jgi:hypothetical protein
MNNRHAEEQVFVEPHAIKSVKGQQAEIEKKAPGDIKL